jgi:RNA polymerase sigma-70 factor (ECF subfamily)
MDLGPASPADTALSPGLPESTWIEPVPDARVLPESGDPADLAAARETIRLAFVAALQHLPPKQRAVLILREVLRWQATEVAELLDTTVASVNSALQRARATLDAADIDAEGPVAVEAEQRDLLARYVDAFERYDIAELVTLLHEDATFTMPPYPLWLRGPDEVAGWLLGTGIACKGSRTITTWANGCPAFGSYKAAGPDVWEPWCITVVEVADGRITGLHHFLDTSLFASFGLPPRIEATASA